MPVLSRSIMRPKLVSAILAAAVGITAGAVVSPGPAAASIPARGYYIAAAPMTMHKAADPSAAGPQNVMPFAVASAFVLYNPGYRRSNYVYDSDWGPATELYCSGS